MNYTIGKIVNCKDYDVLCKLVDIMLINYPAKKADKCISFLDDHLTGLATVSLGDTVVAYVPLLESSVTDAIYIFGLLKCNKDVIIDPYEIFDALICGYSHIYGEDSKTFVIRVSDSYDEILTFNFNKIEQVFVDNECVEVGTVGKYAFIETFEDVSDDEEVDPQDLKSLSEHLQEEMIHVAKAVAAKLGLDPDKVKITLGDTSYLTTNLANDSETTNNDVSIHPELPENFKMADRPISPVKID